ncbi:hypothetical protein ANCCAN_23313 [Ancylostoma caninum]|uniref:Uncharacterized protein n=1 Tax=Ancylostoma caninum TaxID=29170 RepID=A0A368FIX4_ANCCA|nr:hypothetical protein ANCCAN_23313 [Ancylostoma caninum]
MLTSPPPRLSRRQVCALAPYVVTTSESVRLQAEKMEVRRQLPQPRMSGLHQP